MSPYKSKKIISLKPALAWQAILGLVWITIGLIVVGLGSILNYFFPAAALLVGILLHIKYPVLYAGYSWWLWIVSALVRRFADYSGGFTEPSPILLAPYLVTCLILIDVFQYLPSLYRKGGFLFLSALLGVMYGFLVGLIQHPFQPVLLALLEWLTPILSGFYFFVHWKDYPKYRQNTQAVFTWAVLLAGSYGIYQYLVAPPWDQFWLKQAEMVSAGRPEPRKIRVWGTMNSPAAFASFLMSGLLILLTRIEKLPLTASVIGYIAFLLTLVRAAWLGWLLGIMSFFTSLKQSYQLRLILVGLGLVLCVVPLAANGPFAETIGDRLNSLTNISQDSSANARTELYDEALRDALFNVLGTGLVDESVLDSGVIAIFSALGWIGSGLYLSGLSLALWNIFGDYKVASDSFSRAASAVALGTFFRMLFGRSMIGVIGIFMWSFLGLSLAAYKHHKWSSTYNQNPVLPSQDLQQT